MLRAVLDANVFVSAVIRPKGPPGAIIEAFLRNGAFALILSPAIIDEISRALKYPELHRHFRRSFNPEIWFEDLALLSEIVAGEQSIAPLSRDPDDDKYIAAALEGRADFLVTGDLDLLSIQKFDQVRIATARQFLNSLAR